MDQAANTPGFRPIRSLTNAQKAQLIANRRALGLPLYRWMVDFEAKRPRPVKK